ncbi:translin [Bicyclus anynana]|uniref:Translin n=1 Tax=Bicyclus anynana TaxID=110368 RepID=A0A6J1NE83_BICAN|nr:translin [Bicyclus anynana]
MIENNATNLLFSAFQKKIEEEQEVREVIRNLCKEVDKFSREITAVLQVMHHSEEGISPACLKARRLLDKVNEGYAKLKEVVPATDYYKYQEHWRFMTQKYCYLISLIIWLEKGILASHETVAEVLGISTLEQTTGFHLDLDDYLVGLLCLCSELARLAVNSVTRDDYEKPLRISKFVMDLNSGFRLLNIKNDHLRKRYDALRYDVRKIEEVVYDLSIRGLLPKPDAENALEMPDAMTES